MSTSIRFILALALAGLIAWILPAMDETDGWSLFPPLAAIGVAVSTGRLILGLSTAVLSGAFLTLPSSTSWYLVPWETLERALVNFVWGSLRQSFQLYILGFTVSLIGMVRVIALAGGTQGIAQLLAARAESARAARIATFLMGLAIFFDDYSNTLVVGTTMRPIADRFKVSREKLAYLVDSTAAPIAGIAVISTWIGYEVGLFEKVMRSLGTGISGYELFFRALPTRFYCIFTLCFVALSTFLRRDFGPMLKAERRAQQRDQVLAPEATPMTDELGNEIQSPSGIDPHWGTAAAPVVLVIGGVLLGIYLVRADIPDVVSARQHHGFLSQTHWVAILSGDEDSGGENSKVMFIASLAGSLLAFLIALTRRDQTSGKRPLQLGRVLKTWVRGITGFYYALAILILAWAIQRTCEILGTDSYLKEALTGQLEPTLLPLLVFLFSALIAFAIGTSWGTMSILLPTTLPLAFELGGAPLVVLVASAVLDGAIFGDHCSPISDTTVLSSVAAAADHMDHVKTQLPYALVTMVTAAIFGYLGGTLLYSPGLGLLLGLAFLTALLFFFGSNPDAT